MLSDDEFRRRESRANAKAQVMILIEEQEKQFKLEQGQQRILPEYIEEDMQLQLLSSLQTSDQEVVKYALVATRYRGVEIAANFIYE